MNPLANDFSLFCRLFGNLFYRDPTVPILQPTFTWLSEANLRQNWVISPNSESENALLIIEKNANPTQLQPYYQALFSQSGLINTKMENYPFSLEQFLSFCQQNSITIPATDHVASLLLTASWIEDHIEDSAVVQLHFFEQFLLPCSKQFLTQVSALDSGFYWALAKLTIDLLAAMSDELEETLSFP